MTGPSCCACLATCSWRPPQTGDRAPLGVGLSCRVVVSSYRGLLPCHLAVVVVSCSVILSSYLGVVVVFLPSGRAVALSWCCLVMFSSYPLCRVITWVVFLFVLPFFPCCHLDILPPCHAGVSAVRVLAGLF